MLGTATERPDLSGSACAGDVAPVVRAYLAAAGGDPYRALADAVADALHDRDAWTTALRERDRQVSAGYVRARPPTADRP